MAKVEQHTWEDPEFGKIRAKNFAEQAALVSLARIKLWEQRMNAFNAVVDSVRQRSGQDTVDTGDVLNRIWQQLTFAYQNLFMFALICQNPQIQKKAAELASGRFLRDRMSVASYLDIYGDYGSVNTVEESEFLADVREKLIELGVDQVMLTVDCPRCRAYRGQSCRDNKLKKIPSHEERNAAALVACVNPKE